MHGLKKESGITLLNNRDYNPESITERLESIRQAYSDLLKVKDSFEVSQLKN